MTEFTDLELSKPVDEMEAGEARETLAEFMDSHRDNRDAYDSLQTQFSEREDELEDRVDTLEATVSEFKQEKAQAAAEHVKMPAELLETRFSIEELETIIEEGEEFSESTNEDDEDDGPELTSFSEKEEKGRTDGDGGRSPEFRDRAAAALRSQGMHIGGDD